MAAHQALRILRLPFREPDRVRFLDAVILRQSNYRVWRSAKRTRFAYKSG